jgi:hypothetical protein
MSHLLKTINMKNLKILLLAGFAVIICMALFCRCNNNPEPENTGAAKKDTVVVKDSVTVKEIKK